MMDKLDKALYFQQEALSLLARRQDILASNIANADTPGYLARDIDFSQQLKQAVSQQRSRTEPLTLNLTAARHIPATATVFNQTDLLYRIPDQPSAGNDSNLLIVFYVQIMPDDFVMQLHRF